MPVLQQIFLIIGVVLVMAVIASAWQIRSEGDRRAASRLLGLGLGFAVLWLLAAFWSDALVYGRRSGSRPVAGWRAVGQNGAELASGIETSDR